MEKHEKFKERADGFGCVHDHRGGGSDGGHDEISNVWTMPMSVTTRNFLPTDTPSMQLSERCTTFSKRIS